MFLRIVLLCYLVNGLIHPLFSQNSSSEGEQLKIIEQKLLATSLNSDSCQYYLNELKSYDLISQDEYWINRYNFLEAICLREGGNYNDAKEMIESYINYTQDNNLKEEEAFAYFHLTQEFSNQLEASEYQEYINRAINLYTELEDQTMLCNSLINKGINLRKQRLYTESEEVLSAAWDIAVESNDSTIMPDVLNSLGVLQGAQGNFEQAIEYFKRQTEINRLTENKMGLASSLGNMGFGYIRMNQIAEGEKHILQAHQIKEEIGNPYDMAMSFIQLSELNVLQNKWKTALSYNSQSLKIAVDANLQFVEEQGYRQLSYIQENMGDYKSALSTHKKYFNLKDKILNEKINENAQKVEAAYQVGEKEKEILKLELEDQLRSSQLRNQKLALVASAIGIGLLSFLLFRLFGQNKKIKVQNQIITKASQEKEVLLKEIHHRVKNNLQVISSLLGLQSMSITDQKAKDAIQEGRSRVHSMSLIHQNLYKKDNLTGIEMEPYLEKLCAELVKTYYVGDTEVTVYQDVQSDLMLDVETVVPIGLIINELVTNSLKYAFEKREKGLITVKLKEDKDQLHLSVDDDGVGLNDETLAAKKDSFGHSLIRAFKDKLDAELTITGENGTSVSMTINKYNVAQV